MTVLCHDQDPVIPVGARMADYVKQNFPDQRNVRIIRSPQYGHANLSKDMKNELTKV